MKQHLDKLDFLRGIAIILVVGYHIMAGVYGDYALQNYNGFFLYTSGATTSRVLLNLSPFAFGNTGVTLFLILSGFLIHYNYISYNYISKDVKFNTLLFYNKRFWRIYPPYLLALIIFGIFYEASLSDWFHHLFMIHNLRNEFIYSINPSFWSLALEVQLYLIYPLFLFLYHKFGYKRSFLITAAISFSLVMARIVVDIEKTTYIKSVFSYWIIWTSGAYLAHLYYHKKRLIAINFTHLIVLSLSLILLRLTVVHHYFSPYLFTLLFILLIDWILHTEIAKTKIYSIIETIGLCSYSLYLFHHPVILFFQDNVFKQYQFAPITKTIILVAVSGLVTLISYVSYRKIEIPAANFGSFFYKRFLQKTLPSANQD
ncbi:MAG: acyltransferase [Sphingobacteriaceae bacterium]|nr:acyltransferase [Sphingobacteriaceae bacterium]